LQLKVIQTSFVLTGVFRGTLIWHQDPFPSLVDPVNQGQKLLTSVDPPLIVFDYNVVQELSIVLESQLLKLDLVL